MVDIFEPDNKLVSNLYSTIESIRKMGITTVSDSDVNHDLYGVHLFGKGSATDSDVKNAIYRASRQIDKYTATWFYPKCIRIPVSISDLRTDTLFLPSKIFNLNEVSIYHNAVLLNEDQYEIDIDASSIAFDPELTQLHIRSAKFVGIPDGQHWEVLFDNDSFSWYNVFNSHIHNIVVEITLGHIEDCEVPTLIQKASRYFTVEDIVNEQSGKHAGNPRGLLRSETTDGHSYTLDSAIALSKARGGSIITGVSWVDQILESYTWRTPGYAVSV